MIAELLIIAHCVCGEAENQGVRGQIGIAHAISNRGHLKGVYGCKSTRETTDSCVRATETAENTPDSVGGADHWLSDDDLKSPPGWVKRCKKTVKIGKHTFYKCSGR
jgi:spore germination cell wall hydrolase CwlJ-like protein